MAQERPGHSQSMDVSPCNVHWEAEIQNNQSNKRSSIYLELHLALQEGNAGCTDHRCLPCINLNLKKKKKRKNLKKSEGFGPKCPCSLVGDPAAPSPGTPRGPALCRAGCVPGEGAGAGEAAPSRGGKLGVVQNAAAEQPAVCCQPRAPSPTASCRPMERREWLGSKGLLGAEGSSFHRAGSVPAAPAAAPCGLQAASRQR